MASSILIQLASILVLGISSQWIAWRLRLPSIIILLVVGFIAGPITGFLNPAELLGEIRYPLVSLLVSIIVFEGGLSLRLVDLKNIVRPLLGIISIGTLLTYFIISAASYFILNLNFQLSILFGAMMVLTGPTVIIPMLRHVKLSKKLGSLIRWEGIMIEPVGVILIVFSHQLILSMHHDFGSHLIFLAVAKIIFLGSLIGAIAAFLVLVLIKKNWAPEDMQEVNTLMLVIAAFTFSNLLQADSGIIAVIVMGIILANQRKVMVRHIIVFKENLRILAISSLFIILAAGVELSDLIGKFDLKSFYFLIVLIVISRPIPIFISTIGSGLSFKEKLFLSWMAPRGIIAAALASLFALELIQEGIPNAGELVPLTFMVIIVTVTLYGLTATKLQQWLQLSDKTSSGVLIVGANKFARKFAKALTSLDILVLLVDTNKDYVIESRLQKLPAFHKSIFSEKIHEQIQLGGYGSILSLTASDEVNMLASIQYAEEFNKDNIYRLLPNVCEANTHTHLNKNKHGRFLFEKGISFEYLNIRINSDSKFHTLEIKTDDSYQTFLNKYGKRAISLCLLSKSGKLHIAELTKELNPKVGDRVIILV